MMQKYITNIQFKLLKCQIKSRINIYIRIIQKECINTTIFKVILIHFYFNANTSTIYLYCNKLYYICQKSISHGRIKGKRDNKPKRHISS